MNNEIINIEDYREALRYFTKLKKTSFRTLSLQTQLHTSYISRVMAGKCEFSEEQIHKIGQVCPLAIGRWRISTVR